MRPACIVCNQSCKLKFKKNNIDIFQCTQCGLGFAHPIPSKEYLKDLYLNTYYKSNTNFGYHSTSYEELESGLKKTYQSILLKLPKRSYNRILDIGCAYAYFSDVAKEILKPTELFCLDITKEAEDTALKKGYSFRRGFIEDIEFQQEHFDLIFIGDCFEHLQNPIQVVKKLSQMLSPKGIILLTTVNFKSIFSIFFGLNWRLLNPPEHLFYWTHTSLVQLFNRFEFEGKTSDYWLYYPKKYVSERFKEQFKFPLPFISFLPLKQIPIWSFDVLLGIFIKR